MTPEALEQYFKDKDIPKDFQLDKGVKIVDPEKFVKTQLLQVKEYGVKSPAYDRLMMLWRKLEV